MAKKVIGVLTSGGDAQGMNACLKTIVTMASRNDMEVVAFLGGFQGLLDDNFKKLTPKDVEMCYTLGGSVIFSGRSKDFTIEEKRVVAKDVFKKHKLSGLIVLGGDGSIRGSRDLQAMGLNVLAIPCTIDNDVACTDKTIGFDTAVNNAVDAIDNIQQTMKANGRVLIVEVMGRHCGDIALYGGMCSESDIIMLPEKKQSVEKIVREIGKQISVGNISPTVVISENQLDINNLAKTVEEKYGKEVRAIVVGYIQRGGKATMQDRLLATRMAVGAVECIIKEEYGGVIVVVNDEIKFKSFDTAIKEKKHFREDIWQTFLNLKKFVTIKK